MSPLHTVGYLNLIPCFISSQATATVWFTSFPSGNAPSIPSIFGALPYWYCLLVLSYSAALNLISEKSSKTMNTLPYTIKLENVSKFYKLYNAPKDRLKEALHPFKKKYHREFYALSHVCQEIKKGEILGIVGKNGSGKSTLLKLIARIIQPSTGIIKTNGKISALTETNSGLNPEFTGMQNIFFNGTMMGYTRKQMEGKVDEIVDFADIGDFIHQPLKTYSSGMKARLGFAVAASIDPEILILDEILAVGDDMFRRKCFARMESFFKSGCTVLFVSHSMGSINEICTRAILLDEGELLLDGAPKLVTANYLKLLFTPTQEKPKLKNELRQLNHDENKKNEFLSHLPPKKTNEKTATGNQPLTQENINNNSENLTTKTKPLQEPLFIPDFISKTIVKYVSSEVEIEDIRIITLDGKPVNALVMNQTYIYTYCVQFNVTLENVTMGMQIKTEKGLRISGAASYRNKQYLSHVSPGERYRVDWTFECGLLPGTYFTNAGVAILQKDDLKQIAHIDDALIFKVQEVPNTMYAGLVHLKQKLLMTKIAGSYNND